jgi:phage terminase large subunit-like protein
VLTELPPPSPEWAPAFSVPSRSNKTLGPEVTDFAATLLKASRGFKVGEALEFTAWQSWLMDRLLELDPDTGLMRYRKALVLLPRKNGKSLLGTSLALHHLVFGEAGGQVYSAASDRSQAKIVFGEARQQVLNNPSLSRILKVYRDAIELPSKGSVYRPLSADAMRAHGLGPSLVVADELHAWPSSASNQRGDELWDALTQGSADRPESLVVGITTAGGHTDTLLGRLYEHGKAVVESNGELDPQFGFWSWEASNDDDPTDPEVWRKANPNLAEGLLDIGDFEAAIASAGSAGFAGFQRYRLNQWVRMAGEDFISPHHYTEAQREESVALGAEVVAGFDGSVSGDATGIVIQDVATGTMTVHAVWEPDHSDPDWTVDRADVNRAMELLFENYNVRMLWCDPSFYEPDVLEWSKRWKKRVERIPPTNHRIAPMAQQFIADLVAKEIGGDQDPRLKRHCLNAVATEAGSFKKEKKASPRKVDLLACAVLANGARHATKDRKQITTRRATIL